MSEIHIKDESSSHIYRTELPNIIYEIGLSPQLIGVYATIKRSAGDGGYCSKSERNIAKQLLITPKTLRVFLSKLCEINVFLKKPLIISKKRFSEYGDKETSLITITDIWPENYKMFTENRGGGVKFTPPEVNFTPGVGEFLPQGGVKITYKEEPFKKNPLKKNFPPSSSDSEKREGAGDNSEKKKLIDLINASIKHKMPFSETGILEAIKVSSPYAVQEVLKSYHKRSDLQKNLKIPDRWLRSEAIKLHEYQSLKKDYEN